MRYFSIYIPDSKANAGRPEGKRKDEMDSFIAGAIERGELILGGGFLPLRDRGIALRRRNGETSVMDGPYAESKELLGGFALLEFPSREAAAEGTRRFLEVAGDGECVTYEVAIDEGAAIE